MIRRVSMLDAGKGGLCNWAHGPLSPSTLGFSAQRSYNPHIIKAKRDDGDGRVDWDKAWQM